MAKAKRLPSGNYRTRVYVNGVCESFTAPTKKESEYLASDYLLHHKESRFDDVKINSIVKRFIDEREKYISPSTTRTYLWTYEKHIEKLDCKVSEWSSKKHQEWLDSIDLAPKTIKNINGLLVSALKYFDITPPKVNLPQKEFKNIKVPTTEDVKKIIEYFEKREDQDMINAVYLASVGTLRRGEVCALEKEDIDPKNNTIFITKSQAIDKSENFIIKSPKTYASNRLIVLPEFLIELLLKGSEPVNLNVLQVTERFKRCIKSLNMEYTFHSLRHYSASVMHAQNIPTQYIMERGGWKTESTLNRIYRNSLDDYQKKFTDMSNNYFEKNFK